MLINAVQQFLNQAGCFSEEFKSELELLVHEQFYRNKQIVQASGQVELNTYLIESGFVRGYYYDHKGNEHTLKFWVPGDLIFSYEGYYKVPSHYYIEFMDESKAYVLSYEDLIHLQKSHTDALSVIKYAMLRDKREEHEREAILALPANERYRRLLNHNHTIFQKSPAKYIASYLNMSRETLARFMGKS